jgi:hypothetical protein
MMTIMRGKYVETFGIALLCLGFMGFISKAMAAPVELLNATTTQWRFDQSGVDLGQLWRGTDYVDDSWQTGFGLFTGAETTSYGLPFNTTSWTRTAPDTVYVRTRFTWNGSNQGLILTGTLYIDDGCVIYINGREAYRWNISFATWPVDQAAFGNAGSGTYAITADPIPGGEPYRPSIQFPGTNVYDGENVIAVQVHQNSDTSSDVVFGLQLYGDVSTPPVITTDPVGTNMFEGRTLTLSVVASGLPFPTYQWYKDNLPITDATNATYTVASATTANSGQYYVVATNPAGSDTSATVTVTVNVDNVSPQFVYGALLQNGTVRLVWDEVMSNFLDGFSVFIYDPNGGGDFVGVQNVPGIQTDGATFLVTPNTNLTIGINYKIFIGSGGFKDRFGNNSPDENGSGGIERDLGTEIVIATYNDPWKYFYSTDPVANELITNQPPSARFYSTTYDDSAWSSGLPPFGTETTLPDGLVIATPVPTLPITTYYRLHFFVDRAADIRSMNLARVLYDDGFVVFLNGVETGRSGVATGQDSLTTGASHEASAYSGQAWTIPTDLLVDGENIIAVELHNVNTTSTDNVWASEVRGVVNTVILRLPEVESQTLGPINLAERDSLTLNVVARGTQPLHYQWKLGPNAVANATNATYHVPSVTTANAGTYVLSITNLAGSVNSTSIVVNITPDTVRPTVVSAVAALDSTQININFSEPITEATATNVANYSVALRAGGGDLTIVSAAQNDGTNVVLTTSARQEDNYRLTVRNLTDLAFAANQINPNPTVVDLPTEVILADYTTIGQWTYNDTTETAAPAGWNLRSFTPGADWKVGSPLFYGKRGTPGTTSIPTMTTLNLSNAAVTAQITSFYFRVSINLSAAQVANTPIKFRYILDDGAVFYVNDTEVLRAGMPTGTIGNGTLANRTVGNDMLWEDPVAISPNTFAAGANLVAVEAHQVSATSSDLAFALQVVGTQGTIVPPLRITSISLNAQNQVILTHNGVSAGQTVYVQETGVLAANPANTVWTTRSGGPHASPYNAGAATTTRFFRLKNGP